MGTPEDVAAEKYFTPPTLTQALRSNLNMEPDCDANLNAMEETIQTIKNTFKNWLSQVGLPTQMSEESTRQLLITLVDEP